jgi:DNA-binding MarR family transcriptional regulator
MKHKVTPEDNNLWLLLYEVRDLLLDRESDLMKKIGITPQQFQVLAVLTFLSKDNDKAITMSDLLPILNRSLPGIWLIIDRMEKNGLIKKICDIPEKRYARLVINPLGAKLLHNALIPHAELRRKLLSVLPKKDKKQFIAYLSLLKRNIIEETHLSLVKQNGELLNGRKVADYLDYLV